jgi:hypothetical protein
VPISDAGLVDAPIEDTAADVPDVADASLDVPVLADVSPDVPAIVDAETEPSCRDQCTLTQTECAGDGTRACVAGANGCTVWGPAVPCATGETCEHVGAQAVCVSPSVPVPRPIAPLSTSTVTSQRPIFRWALNGAEGADVEICRDRSCTQSVTTFLATGSSGAPSTTLAAGVYYWRLRGTQAGAVGAMFSVAWEFTVGARNTPVNTSWGTTLDVNGDGFADVLVGAIGSTYPRAGAAYLYMGGGGGVSSTPVTIASPAGFNGIFGYSVASAGDVNGDGFGDAIVGAYGANSGDGAACLYLGSGYGLSTTPTVLLGPARLGGQLGYSVASVGDVNGDGYADVAIGMAHVNQTAGQVSLYFGGPAGLDPAHSTTLPGPGDTGGYFGWSPARAADINGDGFGDFIIAAPGAGGTGQAYIYLGSASGSGLTSPIVMKGQAMGFSEFGVVAMGDINADGYADAVFGYTSGMPSLVHVRLGSAAGLAPVSATIPISVGNGALADINGEGFSDLVTGASNGPGGDINVLLGSAGGLSTAITTFAGPNEAFTPPVAAGDINGDGFADIVVGAYGQNMYAGAAYVFLGGGNGLSQSPAMIAAPAGSPGDFGLSLARAFPVKPDPSGAGRLL